MACRYLSTLLIDNSSVRRVGIRADNALRLAIEDLAGADNDAHLFPGFSKLSVDSRHTTAFENHGRATNFRSTSKGMEDIELQRHSATDIAETQEFSYYHKALAAGAIAFFECPVPGCERVFSPITEISQFYNHLEDAVHWGYFDANGPVQCELDCGRAFINHMSFNHIATSRCMAEEIQRTGRADIQSIAVIGGQRIKGTLVPSFAANQRIETEQLYARYKAGEYFRNTQREAVLNIVHANRATDDYTNQLLRAHMKDLRPVLVSMGQNAISHNYSRFSLFMELYTEIYGPLDVVILVPKDTGDHARDEETAIMCPLDFGTYNANFFTSVDFIDHNSEKRVSGAISILEQRMDKIDETNKAISDAKIPAGSSRGGLSH